MCCMWKEEGPSEDCGGKCLKSGVNLNAFMMRVTTSTSKVQIQYVFCDYSINNQCI